MGRKLIITEKPSVARDFARVLHVDHKHTGYIDSSEYIVTWCVGHLVEMVYPEEYDARYKKWRLEDLPFLPREYKYGVIGSVADQYRIVNGFLHSEDVDTVYWAGDSGKEGQTIEENIRNFGGVREGIEEKRVWIDSQTDEEILRGIAQAKPMSAYASLGKSGIMRAIEDYALGINFSRALSVKYGQMVNKAAATRSYTAIAVGRVMTCVLGMVVDREREIRSFVETPFFRVIGSFTPEGLDAEWRCDEKSVWHNTPALYKENGFRKEADAAALIRSLNGVPAAVESVEKSRSKKKPPALFNLAELQAECSRLFKISPDETLQVAQTLYERKMTTYPRTDARVLSTAAAKEIVKNVTGLQKFAPVAAFAAEVLSSKSYAGIEKSPYTDDSKVTDHYCIIPTGQVDAFGGLNDLQKKIYELIARRFLSIFYPPAEFAQLKVGIRAGTELFTASGKVTVSPGYLKVAEAPKKETDTKAAKTEESAGGTADTGTDDVSNDSEAALAALSRLKKGEILTAGGYRIKEGKTSPPKRYTSGTMILAMENAGNLIEDEELRAQIRNTGIGTSATRAEIIRKLVHVGYLNLNGKTQVLTPARLGEMIYEVVTLTAPTLLNPQMSASWEKGLDQITRGETRVEDYREKLEDYIRTGTLNIAGSDLSAAIADAIEKQVPEGKEGEIALPVHPLGLACPVCGGELTTTTFGYGCTNYKNETAPCRFSIGKIAGKRLSEEDFRDLILTGKTKPLNGFRSKAGKYFSASVVLKKDENGMLKAAFDFPETGVYTLKNCSCPICGGAIRKTTGGFACVNHTAGENGRENRAPAAEGAASQPGCIFSVGSVYGKKLTEGSVRELAANGITSPIRGFEKDGISFAACIALKKDETGRITGMKFVPVSPQ